MRRKGRIERKKNRKKKRQEKKIQVVLNSTYKLFDLKVISIFTDPHILHFLYFIFIHSLIRNKLVFSCDLLLQVDLFTPLTGAPKKKKKKKNEEAIKRVINEDNAIILKVVDK